METIEFTQTHEELLKIAATAAREGKYILCVHNLWDALALAKDKEEKGMVFRCFSDMFSGIGNVELSKNALFRACTFADAGGYYSISFSRFFPVDEPVIDEELPLPDAEIILAYNDVYNYFITGQYEKGLDILCETPPDPQGLDNVIGVLIDAIKRGKKVDLSTHSYKLLLLAGIYSTKSADFVRVLLQGGDVTRALMVDGVNFFVGEIEDRKVLCDVGEAFAMEEVYDCALICFEKVLEDCEIDEKALFYLSAIHAIRGETDLFEKYWNTYKLVYKPFTAPVAGYERMFKSKEMPIYGTVPFRFIRNDYEIFGEIDNEWTADEIDRVANIFAFTESVSLFELSQNFDFSEERYLPSIRQALLSPYAPEERKKVIVRELLSKGFEGRIAMVNDRKGIIFDCVKFIAPKNHKVIWETVYLQLSFSILTTEEFLPYRPNLIAAMLRRIAQNCADKRIKPTQDDMPFLCWVLAQEYNNKAAGETNIGMIPELWRNISGIEITKGMKKYPREVLKR